MFPEQLKKILNLIKKTGDRVVIFDASAPDDSYVIMGLDNYAAGFNNQPAAADLKTPSAAFPQASSAPLNIPLVDDLPDDTEEKENLTEEDLTDKINREISMWKNRENSAYLGEDNKPKKAWQIPPQVKDKAQEVE